MQLLTKSSFEYGFDIQLDLLKYGKSPVFDISEEIPDFSEKRDEITLHFALERNNKWDVFRLIENPEIDLNLTNKEGLTPLIFSVMYNEGDMTEMLLSSEKKPIDIDAKDLAGKTALACAAAKNKLPALNALLARGAKCDLTDHCGDTPITWASRLGHTSILESLLTHEKSNAGLVALLDSKNSDGRTALMLAVEGQHLDAVRLLLKAGASAEIRGPHGVSLLDLAVGSNNPQLIELVAHAVIPKGATDANFLLGLLDRRVVKQSIQMDKWDGLLTLSQFGFKFYDEIEKNILKRPIPESVSYKYSSAGEDQLDVRLKINPLILALDLNLTAAAEIMALEKPQCVAWANGMYETPIMLACKIGNIRLIDQFLKNGANITGENYNRESCAHYAAQNGQVKVITHLAGLVDDQSRDSFVWQCVKGAIQHENPDLLKFVLSEFVVNDVKAGKAVTGFNRESPQGFTALTFATSFDRVDSMRVLLSFNDELRFSPSLLKLAAINAARYGHAELLSVLMEYSLHNGRIPQMVLEEAIYAASLEPHWDALNLLLQATKSINYDIFENCFQLAADHGRLDVLQNLFDRGTYPNEIHKYVKYAVTTGHVEVLNFFLEKGVRRSVALSEFVEAAGRGHMDMVNLLIANASGEQLQSALVSAARGGHWEVVTVLSAEGANIHEASPFFAEIAGGGHLEMLAILLSPRISPQELESAMCAAAKNGHATVVHFLSENGVNLSCVKSSFEQVVYSGHFEIAKILIESGTIEVDLEEYLPRATYLGDGALIRLLIGLETSAWRVGDALIGAAAHGDLETVELILGNERWRQGIAMEQLEDALKEATSRSYSADHVTVAELLLQLEPRKEVVFAFYSDVESSYELTQASEELKVIKRAMNVLSAYLGFTPASAA